MSDENGRPQDQRDASWPQPLFVLPDTSQLFESWLKDLSAQIFGDLFNAVTVPLIVAAPVPMSAVLLESMRQSTSRERLAKIIEYGLSVADSRLISSQLQENPEAHQALQTGLKEFPEINVSRVVAAMIEQPVQALGNLDSPTLGTER